MLVVLVPMQILLGHLLHPLVLLVTTQVVVVLVEQIYQINLVVLLAQVEHLLVHHGKRLHRQQQQILVVDLEHLELTEMLVLSFQLVVVVLVSLLFVTHYKSYKEEKEKCRISQKYVMELY
jgi:hypothetical protein